MEEKIPASFTLLEETLSQQIRALYTSQLGHSPQKVICNLLDKTLTILVEHAMTPPERLLIESGKHDLVEEVRWNLCKAIEPHLKAIIEAVVKVPVVDLIGTSNIDSDRTSITAVLAAKPQ
ncbi:DUF2294 domain-containing protein [Gloeocapsopsis dulcis]|uniref:Na+-translocating membrane potential-generating system MpsC domain-containing protein n=1 Tax=Gloeocapsopsis dulcis AAB1 = 1H9 TaxID=1433147 RepID=A0A6N8FNR9_9CHRO|nr:DUF2294 domain-containing protein [Gloeocapsopsis dulcis]MUL34871.1 hypothetical protein [Gloeocapsopsis dulcis AAB1 = 1H9]WNN90060.1 DUF2294 domain-containing protein [Gloeocapsopsis dulcis]